MHLLFLSDCFLSLHEDHDVCKQTGRVQDRVTLPALRRPCHFVCQCPPSQVGTGCGITEISGHKGKVADRPRGH